MRRNWHFVPRKAEDIVGPPAKIYLTRQRVGFVRAHDQGPPPQGEVMEKMQTRFLPELVPLLNELAS
jgi:hypothetical protein